MRDRSTFKILKFVPGLLILISTACFSYRGMAIGVNQEVALKKMRNIRAAQRTYKKTKSSGSYGTMGDLIASGLISDGLGGGNTRGYRYAIRLNGDEYEAVAVPETYGEDGTGIISYYVDQTGVIRGANRKGLEASKDDPLLEPDM